MTDMNEESKQVQSQQLLSKEFRILVDAAFVVVVTLIDILLPLICAYISNYVV
jgi:hypothetical protein